MILTKNSDVLFTSLKLFKLNALLMHFLKRAEFSSTSEPQGTQRRLGLSSSAQPSRCGPLRSELSVN